MNQRDHSVLMFSKPRGNVAGNIEASKVPAVTAFEPGRGCCIVPIGYQWAPSSTLREFPMLKFCATLLFAGCIAAAGGSLLNNAAASLKAAVPCGTDTECCALNPHLPCE